MQTVPLSRAEHVLGCILVNPNLSLLITDDARRRLTNEVLRLTKGDADWMRLHMQECVREMERSWEVSDAPNPLSCLLGLKNTRKSAGVPFNTSKLGEYDDAGDEGLPV